MQYAQIKKYLRALDKDENNRLKNPEFLSNKVSTIQFVNKIRSKTYEAMSERYF
ncbi:MAG: hypothetical protein ACLFN8_00850 [Candidatus Woesearchaeota archaeon]